MDGIIWLIWNKSVLPGRVCLALLSYWLNIMTLNFSIIYTSAKRAYD